MLGNSEKMALISSASSEWMQHQNNQLHDPNMASLVATPPPRVMEPKHASFSQQQQQPQPQPQQQSNNNNQEPLRCPRCDSNNTKFCYYNNYSLSQPRHFCKACKRYWTRGGTLRSVPVGGGCRKNKRVKRPSNHNIHNNNNNNSTSTNDNTSINTTNNHHETSITSHPSNGGGHINGLISSPSNPLFYGIPTNNNHSFMNFPFSRYDLHQNTNQVDGLGLGFSSLESIHSNINMDGINLHDMRNKQNFQDMMSSNSTCTTPQTMSSLLASTFQKKGSGNNFQTILPSYEDSVHMKGSGQGQGGMLAKNVKMEFEGQNRSFDYQWSAPSQNHMDHNNNMGSSSYDPSVIWGNGPNLGAWLDASNNNIGSSIASLI